MPRIPLMVAICHPEVVDDLLRSPTPKEKWKLEHRKQRLARQGRIEPQIYGEVGSWENVRIYGSQH